MYIALKEDGTRVVAEKNIPRDKQYRCPVCGGDVRLRAGDTNSPHFAHVRLQDCPDDFHKPMTEWHRAWQELFPIDNREIVITHNGETHRADVLYCGTVIEFQHSEISEHEFRRRNNFYTAAGYKVVWIFDAIDVVTSGRLDGSGNEWNYLGDSGENLNWKYPWRFLGHFMPQKEVKISIFLQLNEFEENPRDEHSAYMERVVWVDPKYKTLWGRLRTSYKICNFVELVNLLESQYKRAMARQSKDNTAQFLMDDKTISAEELRAYISSHYPLMQVKENAPNNPDKGIGSCPDSHQKPRINAEICYLGCYHCVAVVETNMRERYIYCNYPYSRKKIRNPKWIKKIK